MAEVLFISKAVTPPWNDSSKNLVRDLSASLTRHRPHVMGTRGSHAPWKPPGGVVEPVYLPAGRPFAPALTDGLRVLARLVAGRSCDLWHFFFAPNPRTSTAGRAAARLRRVPTVHTVCSTPAPGAPLGRLLFADVNVVLSHHTEHLLLDAGVPAERLCRIPPIQLPMEVPDEASRRATRAHFGLPADAPLVVYPGDLEFGGGAEVVVRALANPSLRHAHLAMACRSKTAAAREAEVALRARAASLGVAQRIAWVGETPRIHTLLGAADVVALPSASTYAKMDYPLVLLEAMCMERPVVVAQGTAAEELAADGAAERVAPDADAVAVTVGRLLDDPRAARAVGAAARRAVLSRFSPAEVAAGYERVYDRLTGGA
jgi:glycosyltransferase involved in cell wall biosynthesis